MKNFVITNNGKELIAKMIASEVNVSFTKIKTTDQDYSSTDLESLTRLSNERQTALVSGVEIKDDSNVEIFAAITNEDVDTDYYIRAVGLYATDSVSEILFAISLYDGEPDFIPAFTGSNYSGISYKMNVKVGNTEQVTINVDPAASPTMEQVNALEKKFKEGYDITEQDGSISFAQKVKAKFLELTKTFRNGGYNTKIEAGKIRLEDNQRGYTEIGTEVVKVVLGGTKSEMNSQGYTTTGDYMVVDPEGNTVCSLKDMDGRFDIIGIKNYKNLLNPTLQTTTKNGITCTNNGDGTYTLNGTATEETHFQLLDNPDFGDEFVPVGTPPNMSSKARFSVTNKDYVGSIDWNDGNPKVVYEKRVWGDPKHVWISVSKGAVLENALFKPMVTIDPEAKRDDYDNLYSNVKYEDFVPYTGSGSTVCEDISVLNRTKRDMEYESTGGGAELVPKDSELKEGVDFLYRYANNISAEVGSVNASLGNTSQLVNSMSGGDAWVAGTSYAVNDIIIYNNVLYRCIAANSSSTKPTDRIGQYWEVISIKTLNNDLNDYLIFREVTSEAITIPAKGAKDVAFNVPTIEGYRPLCYIGFRNNTSNYIVVSQSGGILGATSTSFGSWVCNTIDVQYTNVVITATIMYVKDVKSL